MHIVTFSQLICHWFQRFCEKCCLDTIFRPPHGWLILNSYFIPNIQYLLIFHRFLLIQLFLLLIFFILYLCTSHKCVFRFFSFSFSPLLHVALLTGPFGPPLPSRPCLCQTPGECHLMSVRKEWEGKYADTSILQWPPWDFPLSI